MMLMKKYIKKHKVYGYRPENNIINENVFEQFKLKFELVQFQV